jgi:membrane-associated phospholipid phosphatase
MDAEGVPAAFGPDPGSTVANAVASPLEGSLSQGRTLARQILGDAARIDVALYDAVVATPTQTLDEPLRALSTAANRSVIWLGIAAGLAAVGGRRGRRAAVSGVASILVSSAVVNLPLKSLTARKRPDHAENPARHVRTPASSSFPSGHSAAGFAFATAVGRELPLLSLPLRGLAAAVAYSRVHTGVHYPGDTIAGSLIGGAIGLGVSGTFERRLFRQGGR